MSSVRSSIWDESCILVLWVRGEHTQEDSWRAVEENLCKTITKTSVAGKSLTLKVLSQQPYFIHMKWFCFKPVSSQHKLSHQQCNFCQQSCSFHFFRPLIDFCWHGFAPFGAHLTNQNSCCQVTIHNHNVFVFQNQISSLWSVRASIRWHSSLYKRLRMCYTFLHKYSMMTDNFCVISTKFACFVFFYEI